MQPKTKKIIAAAAILAVLFIVGYQLFPREEENEKYIFDKSYNITLEDVKKARAPLPLDHPKQQSSSVESARQGNGQDSADNASGIDLRKIFSEGLINSYTTLKYFRHLGHKFKDSADLDEHLAQVKKYLFSRFSEQEARKLFETYKKYLQCEIDTAKEFKDFGRIGSPQEAIDALRKIQEFRRERLGKELADKLYGAEVKAQEYAFRRAAIVGDDSLYGNEKEELLSKLDEDMWGDEAKAVEDYQVDTPTAWKRFLETKEIYKKDLDELGSDAARTEKIKELRTRFFSPDTVKRLEAVDQKIAENKQKEALYREKEKKILDDKKLSEKEKKDQLTRIQNETFGDQADAFRRRESIRQGRKKLIQEHEKK